VAILAFVAPTQAQTAVAGTDGDGVFRAPGTQFTSTLTFKSDDTSVKVSFATPPVPGPSGSLTYGADITAKSSQGLAAVLKSGTYTPGTKINGYLLRHSVLTDVKSGTDVDWITIQATLSVTQLALFDASRAFADQLTKPTFMGGGVKGTYAYEHAGWLLGGLSAGVERTNNYADMKDIVVTTQKTYMDPATGATRATNTNQVSAKDGTYVEGGVGSIRFDLFMYPSLLATQRLAVTAYETSRFSNSQQLRRSDVGIGLAILKKGSPTISLGAIVVEWKDFLNSQDPSISLGRRLTVSLQGSIPIAPTFGF